MAIPQTILITGASSGIGAETARALGRHGATVALLARDRGRLEAVCREVRDAGGSARFYPVDLAVPSELEASAAAIKREVGIPDVVINNAGAGRWLSILETAPEEVVQMMAVPYFAAFGITRAFLPEMKARGRGHIVNVTSDASFLPKANAIAYSSARYALRGFSEALRADLVGTGVDVSLAVFGKVASTFWANNPGSEERIPAPTPFMPTLSTAEVAQVLVRVLERRPRLVVRPGIFRLLFWAFRHWPDRLAIQMRRVAEARP